MLTKGEWARLVRREGLLQHGITEFPYIFLTKASERAAVDAGERAAV